MAAPKKKPAAKKSTAKKATKKDPLFRSNADTMLNDEQRQNFIDNVVHESSLLASVRKYTMSRSRVEIPRMTLGTRVLKEASIGVTSEIIPDYSAIVLTSSKLTLPWTITEEYLDDNPEGNAAEASILRMMGVTASNDLEDLLINGDESSNDNLLKANNGILKLATKHKKLKQGFKKKPTHFQFKDVLKALPVKYRREPKKLMFLVSPNTYLDYIYEISGKNTGMSNAFLTSLANEPTYMDIKVVANPFMPDGHIVLTNPDNIIFGIEKDMKLRTTTEGSTAIKNDERFYALHLRCDFAIQNADAFILGFPVDTNPLKAMRVAQRVVTTPFTGGYKWLVRKPSHKVARFLSKV